MLHLRRAAPGAVTAVFSIMVVLLPGGYLNDLRAEAVSLIQIYDGMCCLRVAFAPTAEQFVAADNMAQMAPMLAQKPPN